MRQLSGLDAGFLYLESSTTVGHVNGLAILERPSEDYQPFERVYARFEALVGQAPPLRRRLIEVPFNLDLPYWIDDPDFDLGYHVRHLGLAPPGTSEQLGDQIARIAARPMDRTRPLWESYVIEGLADGRWALLTKTHHAAVDGVGGVILLHMMADPDPDPDPEAPEPPAPAPWEPEPVPSDMALLLRTARHAATNPVRSIQIQARLAREVADNLGITGLSSAFGRMADAAGALGRGVAAAIEAGRSPERPSGGGGLHLPLRPAPPTPWNRPISAHRRFAMRSVSLDNVKVLKNATGCTVNDIIMALSAGALRRYLIEHDALPDSPLRAMVPVSVRTFDEDEPWTNRVGALIADLPTNVEDPLERVALCHKAMDDAKHQFELFPVTKLLEASRYAPSLVASSAIRLAARLSDRVNLPVNLVISNVPGPRDPLYIAGARMVGYAPVSIVTDNLGLNITVHSYLDRVEFGLLSDRELVPDLWHLVDLHVTELRALFDATGATWADRSDAGT